MVLKRIGGYMLGYGVFKFELAILNVDFEEVKIWACLVTTFV